MQPDKGSALFFLHVYTAEKGNGVQLQVDVARCQRWTSARVRRVGGGEGGVVAVLATPCGDWRRRPPIKARGAASRIGGVKGV